MKDFIQFLEGIGAWEEVLEWSKSKTLSSFWLECKHPDWMLWLCIKMNWLTEKQFREFACDCAEKVLPIIEAKFENDKRCSNAIEVSRKFTNNEVSEEKLNKAKSSVKELLSLIEYSGDGWQYPWYAIGAVMQSASDNACQAASYTLGCAIGALGSDMETWAADRLRSIFTPKET